MPDSNNDRKDANEGLDRGLMTNLNSRINVSPDLGLNPGFDISKGDLLSLSPLVLAYVGDAVYELYVRTMLVSGGPSNVNKLHKKSINFVKAKAQSDILHKIIDRLLPEEQDIVRRGRNSQSGSIPKNADVIEYKHATGLEALFGYLYLKKDNARLQELLNLAVNCRA